MKPPDKQPPIGYVLKALDTALTAYTDRALEPHQLTRLHWQALNTVQHGNGVTLDQVVEVLGQFADEERLQAVLVELAARQWLQRSEQAYALTAAGEEGLRLAAESQAKVRARLCHGLTREDYESVLETLQKMLQNLSAPANGADSAASG